MANVAMISNVEMTTHILFFRILPYSRRRRPSAGRAAKLLPGSAGY
jgi:hypothetical protein